MLHVWQLIHECLYKRAAAAAAAGDEEKGDSDVGVSERVSGDVN